MTNVCGGKWKDIIRSTLLFVCHGAFSCTEANVAYVSGFLVCLITSCHVITMFYVMWRVTWRWNTNLDYITSTPVSVFLLCVFRCFYSASFCSSFLAGGKRNEQTFSSSKCLRIKQTGFVTSLHIETKSCELFLRADNSCQHIFCSKNFMCYLEISLFWPRKKQKLSDTRSGGNQATSDA